MKRLRRSARMFVGHGFSRDVKRAKESGFSRWRLKARVVS